MDSVVRVVLTSVDYETTCHHGCVCGRGSFPRVALRLLLLSLLRTYRAADLYLALDPKQRLAFLFAFKISARAWRFSAGDADYFGTARDLAAPTVSARSTVGRTRCGRLFS